MRSSVCKQRAGWAAGWLVAAASFLATPAWAQVEITWWHAMTGANGERQYLTSDEIDAERVNAKRDLDAICNSPS